MNLNASIIDQRLTGILQDHLPLVADVVGNDTGRQRSAAFVLLCISTTLDLSLTEAAQLLTEGGNDAGIDALHIGEVEDGEFTVTLFQGKYKHKDLTGAANFPENGIKTVLNIVATLFDPGKQLHMNPRLKPVVEDIRSLIRDGYIPNVRIILCNNGAKWQPQAQTWIDQSGFSPEQVQWLHCNHDSIVTVLQRKKPVNDSIQLHGKAVIEDFNFRRVLIGKVAVTEIAGLFDRHHDLLLERNIRRYLGLHSNRVNLAIHDTLADPAKRESFYFFNNGITMICRKFRHNALQGENYQLKIDGIQIINGGQTCKTIQQTLDNPDLFKDFSNAYVLLRLYELADDDQEFVRDITYATNSQNPVDLHDLRSNDDIQRQLEIGIQELGYTYRRQREEGGSGSEIITSSVLAEAVLAVWRRKPHQAKFRRKEHFGKLYQEIFKDLNPAQAVLAVLIFRMVENERKRPEMSDPPACFPYASQYMAMLMGEKLLRDNQLQLDKVTHREFQLLANQLTEQRAALLQVTIVRIHDALRALYGDRDVSLQQLSATFRRGDLLETLSML